METKMYGLRLMVNCIKIMKITKTEKKTKTKMECLRVMKITKTEKKTETITETDGTRITMENGTK